MSGLICLRPGTKLKKQVMLFSDIQPQDALMRRLFFACMGLQPACFGQLGQTRINNGCGLRVLGQAKPLHLRAATKINIKSSPMLDVGDAGSITYYLCCLVLLITELCFHLL